MSETEKDKQQKTDALLVQTVVLLNRQYLLTQHLIEKGGATLKEFEQAIIENSQPLDNVLDVYNYIFGLIDHLVRYQKIAFVLPKLNKKSKECRALDKAMGKLKDIRNQLQHINNDIENNFTGPLLGGVWWASRMKQYHASFHDIGRERSSSGLILDTRSGKYVHEFCYVYNEIYHDLGKAITGMNAFNEFINSWVKIQIDGKDYDPKDHFAAICFEIDQNVLPVN